MAENIKTPCCCGQMSEEVQKAAAPSSERVKRLRDASFDQHPSISIERALLETEFYREHEGKLPMPVLRGANFKHLCENKTLYIGKDELIVGERGPFPKAVSTSPELTCHTRHDFEVLTTRAQQNYTVASADMGSSYITMAAATMMDRNFFFMLISPLHSIFIVCRNCWDTKSFAMASLYSKYRV